MKKLLFFLLLLIPTKSFAATAYYFDCSVSNYSTCSIGSPCTDLPGTTLDNASALSGDDSLNFKRGNSCSYDGAAAYSVLNSAGSAGHFVYLQSYGTGSLPVFAGGPITATVPTNTAGAIWRFTGQDNTAVRAVAESDTYYGLMRWDGTNANLTVGTYCWTTSQISGSSCTTSSSATNLYVRRYDDGNPTGKTRISNFALPSFGALVESVDNASRGVYHRFRDIIVTNSPDRGFQMYRGNDEALNVLVYGSRRDGATLQDNCVNCWLYYPYVAYNATYGGGTGQGITVGSQYNGITGTGGARADIEYNGQAGFDFLDYGANDVSHFIVLRITSHENGISPNAATSFDPNGYFDGASEGFAYGNRLYDGGKNLAAVAGVSKYNMQIGSEHPTTDPTENIQWINNYCVSAHGSCLDALNTPVSVFNIKNVTLAYNTMVANADTSSDVAIGPIYNFDSTANNWVMRNNVLVGNNAQYVSTTLDTGSYLDSDNNVWYRRGQASGSTIITSDYNGGPTRTLAQWRTASGEDANSVYGDPAFVDETNRDFHLGGSSAALNIGMTSAYTIYSWVPQTIKDDIGSAGIKGSTIAAGTEDDYASAPDAGFHYDYAGLTSTSAVPASLSISSSGNLTATFTIPQYLGGLLYDGKVKIVLPTGWSWSSGGTTAVSSSTISGTWTVGVSSQTATFARVGDGNSEFYGTYNMVLSNVGTSISAGLSGTFEIDLTDSAGTIIMRDVAVAGQTLVQPVGSTGAHFNCTGKLNFIGKAVIT